MMELQRQNVVVEQSVPLADVLKSHREMKAMHEYNALQIATAPLMIHFTEGLDSSLS